MVAPPPRHARRLALLGALALLAACFSSDPGPMEPIGPATVTVGMTDGLAFAPSPVTIRVGDTVAWTNTSSMVHTVTADPSRAANPNNVTLPAGAEPFDSGIVSPGGQFSHLFTVAGEYRYVCLPHESAGMIGTVVVNP